MERGLSPYWLTLCGLPGTGKTMLARQLYVEAARINPGNYRHAPVWVSGHGTHNPDNRRPKVVWLSPEPFKSRYIGGEYDLPECLRADFMVVFDDLGAINDTRNDTMAEALYRLADNRLGRWTVWTTNLTLDEVRERFDARLASRLIRGDNRVVTITAPDYAAYAQAQKARSAA